MNENIDYIDTTAVIHEYKKIYNISEKLLIILEEKGRYDELRIEKEREYEFKKYIINAVWLLVFACFLSYCCFAK